MSQQQIEIISRILHFVVFSFTFLTKISKWADEIRLNPPEEHNRE